MDFKSLGDVIGKYAPLLGVVIGTANPLAGALVGTIASLFGADPANPIDILDKINKDPEAAIKLKKLELEHEKDLHQIALEAYQAQLKDIQDARAAKVASERFLGKDWIISFLVITAVVLFAFCLAGAYFSSGPVNQMFLFLIGQQSGVYLSVYAFYFSGIDPKKMFDNVLGNK